MIDTPTRPFDDQQERYKGEAYLHTSNLPTVTERLAMNAAELATNTSEQRIYADTSRMQGMGRNVVLLPEVRTPEVEAPQVSFYEYLDLQAQWTLKFRADAIDRSRKITETLAPKPSFARTVFSQATRLLVGDPSSAPHLPQRQHRAPALTERELMNRESMIGSRIFGGDREEYQCRFFMLDQQSWIWYEHFPDGEEATTRYENQPHGVLKAQSGGRYSYLEGTEFNHFIEATRMYFDATSREIYGRDPRTGANLR